jgi:hypothetical protein
MIASVQLSSSFFRSDPRSVFSIDAESSMAAMKADTDGATSSASGWAGVLVSLN